MAVLVQWLSDVLVRLDLSVELSLLHRRGSELLHSGLLTVIFEKKLPNLLQDSLVLLVLQLALQQTGVVAVFFRGIVRQNHVADEIVGTLGVSLAAQDVFVVVKEVLKVVTGTALDLELAVELLDGPLEVFARQLFHVALAIGTEVLLLEPVLDTVVAVDLAAVVAALLRVSGDHEADGTAETLPVDDQVAVESFLHQNIIIIIAQT